MFLFSSRTFAAAENKRSLSMLIQGADILEKYYFSEPTMSRSEIQENTGEAKTSVLNTGEAKTSVCLAHTEINFY